MEKPISWSRSSLDWVKVNSDGAVNLGGCASAARVMRDHYGSWIGGFVHNLGCCSIPKTELWGILNGLKMAWNGGFRKVHVETDSKLVVDLIQKTLAPHHPLFSLVSQCQGYLDRNWDIRLLHIFREANYVADSLAGLAFSFLVGFHCLSHPPVGVSLLLLNDVFGKSTPRLVLE